MKRRDENLPEPDVLPTCAAECVTIGQFIELVLRRTQEELAERGTGWMREHNIPGRVHQGQISDLCEGTLPGGKLWPRYLCALSLEGQERQFYRLVLNARKLSQARRAAERALRTPMAETEPLFVIEHGADGAIVKLLQQESGVRGQASGEQQTGRAAG